MTVIVMGGGVPPIGTGGRELFGRATLDGSPWRWATQSELQTGPMPVALFDADIAGGQVWSTGLGVVRALMDFGEPGWTTMSSGEGARPVGAGGKDLALWMANASPQPIVRGWSPDGSGARTVISDLAAETRLLAVSTDAIAGVMGEEKIGGGLEHVRIWHAPRLGLAKLGAVAVSPDLGANAVSLRNMSTSSSHVAVALTQTLSGPDEIVVYDFAKAVVSHVPALAGRRWSGTCVLSGGYLYGLDRFDTDPSLHQARRVVRFALATLEPANP